MSRRDQTVETQRYSVHIQNLLDSRRSFRFLWKWLAGNNWDIIPCTSYNERSTRNFEQTRKRHRVIVYNNNYTLLEPKIRSCGSTPSQVTKPSDIDHPFLIPSSLLSWRFNWSGRPCVYKKDRKNNERRVISIWNLFNQHYRKCAGIGEKGVGAFFLS